MKRFLVPAFLSLALTLPLTPASASTAEQLRTEVDALCSTNVDPGNVTGMEVLYEEVDRYFRVQYVRLSYVRDGKDVSCDAVALRRKAGGNVDLEEAQYGFENYALISVPEASFLETLPWMNYESPLRTGSEVDFLESEIEDGLIALAGNVYFPKGGGTLTQQMAEYVGHPEWEGLDYTYQVLGTARYYVDLKGTQTERVKTGPSADEVEAAKVKLSRAKAGVNKRAKAASVKVRKSSASAAVKKRKLAEIEKDRRAGIARAEATYRKEVKPRYDLVTSPYSSRIHFRWPAEQEG